MYLVRYVKAEIVPHTMKIIVIFFDTQKNARQRRAKIRGIKRPGWAFGGRGKLSNDNPLIISTISLVFLDMTTHTLHTIAK